MIKGEDITYVTLTATDADPFGEPIYSETYEVVHDVCVGNPSANEIVNELNLYGKHIVYTLGIPKGDTHEWKDAVVDVRGHRFRAYGMPITQTDANVPGRWNTQVKVELYE